MSSRARKKKEEMNGNSLGVVLSPGALAVAERSEGERSEPKRSAATAKAGADPASGSRPDPEVVAKPKRRTYTAEYKQRILEEAEVVAATRGVAGCSRAAPERPPPKGSPLAARNPSALPIRPHPTTSGPRPDSPACFAIAIPSPAPRPPSALRSRRLTTFQVQDAGSTPRARHRADADRVAMGWLVVHRWAPHRQDSLGLEFGMLRTSLPLVSAYSSCTEDNERHSSHLAYKSPCKTYAHFLTGTVTALSRPSRV